MVKRIRAAIKNKLIAAFVTLTVVSLLAMETVIYFEVVQQTEEDYSQAVEKEIDQISNGINNYMKLIGENTITFAKDPLMQELGNEIKSYVDESDPSGKVAMIPEKNSLLEQTLYQRFCTFQENHETIESVSLAVEQNGGFVQYPASARFNEYDPRVRDWYLLAKDNPGKQVFTDVYESSNGSQNIISVASILDHQGKILGVVTMNINLDQLTQMVAKTNIGKKGFVVLVDANGKILSNSNNPDSVSQDISTLGIERLCDYKRQTKSFDVTLSDGENYAVGIKNPDYSSDISVNWSYITFVKRSEFRDSAIRINKILAGLFLMVALISTMIIIAISKKITEPISAISKHLTKLGSGDFSRNLDPKYLEFEDEVGEIAKSTAIMQNSLKELLDRINHEATHDYLTGLPNRMHFIHNLTQALERGGRGAVFLFDIDNFKSINDTMGHFVGDILLKEIAKRISQVCDDRLFASRLGGDEFLMILSDVSDESEIIRYAEKVKKVCDHQFALSDREIYVSFSMGITLFPKDSDDTDQLIMNADTAMYKAKASGKNAYIFYKNTMKDEIRLRMDMEEILRKAIHEEAFTLVYQPQVDSKTGEIVSFEALLRLKNSKIGPAQFIPLAEESGLIIDIGRWVAKEVVLQMAKWRDLGFSKKPVAINFSGVQLRDKEYITYLDTLLKENNLTQDYLEIEITEGILLENNEDTIAFLKRLRESNYKIALDDFGTGYSSLNYLTFVTVDKIKFDKSMIDRSLDFENTDMIACLISLVHSLNSLVTAEGVEEIDKFNRLSDNGCDFIQGYLFSRPLPAEEVEEIYDKVFLKSD